MDIDFFPLNKRKVDKAEEWDTLVHRKQENRAYVLRIDLMGLQ